MPTYSVDALYNPNRTSWPECAQYNYRGGEHELLLFWRAPARDEVNDVRKGEAEFALLVEGDVVWLLYRFGNSVRWSDAPFTIHRVPEAERALPTVALGAKQRALLHVTLVDAGTGRVKVLRAISLSHEFSIALHEAILAQAATLWDSASYDVQVDAAYERYPDSSSMVAKAVARTKGGV